MSSLQPRYIAVEGPIGVGKTSLARRLAASFGADLMLEEAEDNPFLERFYRDPRRYSLPTQLYFVFQRVRQYEAMRQTDMFEPVRVTDFLLDKDKLFAQLNLDDDELRLYELVFDKLAVDAPTPDLVIYLQAPVDVLLRRVAQRGINYEQAITRAARKNGMEPLLTAATRKLISGQTTSDEILRVVPLSL